jgi:hypothetical protein
MSVAPGSNNTNTLHIPARFVLVRLFDSLRRPLRGAQFEATLGSKTITGTADTEGYAQLEEPEPPTQCEVRWRLPTSDGQPAAEDEAEAVAYRRVLFLSTELEEGETAVRHRLHNLGYDMDAPLEDCVRAFQEEYGLAVNGEAGDAALIEKLASVHDALSPVASVPPESYIAGDSDGGDD